MPDGAGVDRPRIERTVREIPLPETPERLAEAYASVFTAPHDPDR